VAVLKTPAVNQLVIAAASNVVVCSLAAKPVALPRTAAASQLAVVPNQAAVVLMRAATMVAAPPSPAVVVPMHVPMLANQAAVVLKTPAANPAAANLAAARSVAVCWPRCVPARHARRPAAASHLAVVPTTAAAKSHRVDALTTAAANPAADVQAEIRK
jgi:hypothetical protein